MIYLDLFFGFLKVGLLSFGGAYSALPLIREIVVENGWMTEEKLSYMIGVSESTPGPIMVNMATYVGSMKGGLLGSVIATLAVTLPAFLIILLIMGVLKKYIDNEYVTAVLKGLKACVTGIILSVGVVMFVDSLSIIYQPFSVDIRALIIACILVCTKLIYEKYKKKKLSPIILIIISAICGIIVYV